MLLTLITFILNLFCLVSGQTQEVNRTIDDPDPLIVYVGSWSGNDASPHYFDGKHQVTQDANTSATFTFTGVAIYYLAAKWAFPVTTSLKLDNDPIDIVNLTDPKPPPGATGASEDYSIVWSRTGLDNVEHTLVNTVGSGNYGLMDGIIYTTVASPSSTSSGTLVNKTVDDPDSSIVYTGQWDSNDASSLYYNGKHSFTQSSSASATFVFTGVAIYYMAAKWAFPVTTSLTLDDEPTIEIDLADHYPAAGASGTSEQYSIVWSRTGLPNVQHTLINAMGAGNYGLMDGLIFTSFEAEPPSPSGSNGTSSTGSSSGSSSVSSSSSNSGSSSGSSSGQAQATSIGGFSQTQAGQQSAPSSSSSTDIASTSHGISNKLGIILGTVFGVVGLILVGLLIYFRPRRKVKPVTDDHWSPRFAGQPYNPSMDTAPNSATILLPGSQGPPSTGVTQNAPTQWGHNPENYSQYSAPSVSGTHSDETTSRPQGPVISGQHPMQNTNLASNYPPPYGL